MHKTFLFDTKFLFPRLFKKLEVIRLSLSLNLTFPQMEWDLYISKILLIVKSTSTRSWNQLQLTSGFHALISQISRPHMNSLCYVQLIGLSLQHAKINQSHHPLTQKQSQNLLKPLKSLKSVQNLIWLNVLAKQSSSVLNSKGRSRFLLTYTQ